MQKYRCHKEVEAAKIKEFRLFTPAGSPDRTLEEARKAQVMHLVLEDCPNVAVTHAWMGKHRPVTGGYYVRYADGYESFSPAEAFESGYTAIPDGAA